MIFLSGDNVSIYAVWFFAFWVDLIHHYADLVVFSLMPFLFTKEQIPAINGSKAMFHGMAAVIGPTLRTMAIIYLGLSTSLLVSVVFMIIALILTISLAVMVQLKNDKFNIANATKESFKDLVQKSILGASKSAYKLVKDQHWRTFLLSYSSCFLVIGILTLLGSL